jgi:hypothetical protein
MPTSEQDPPVDPVDSLPIYLRSYTVGNAGKPQFEANPKIRPSAWSLTFDCETTVDAAQRLRFGAFQLRKDGALKRSGLFYDPDGAPGDVAALKTFAAAEGVELISAREFVEKVLFGRAYALGGTVIGFNLPFDISRLAIDHGPARKGMRGGFSFRLTPDANWPRIRVRHISSRMAFVSFAAPPKKRTPEGQRKRGLQVQHRRGYFVDVRTLASALLAEGFDLERLSAVLGVSNRKHGSDEHGGPLTPQYIRYGLNDVQATWECFEVLNRKLASYHLPTAKVWTLYSPASLGKAYLRAMNVRPWQEKHPDFPPELIGQIMSAYYGGRAEVRIRRQVRQTLYCDFLSMYPTVCTLMGLWPFVVAQAMTWRDATAEIQAWLATVTPDDLKDPAAWSRLAVLVQLRPDGDILPVRARYGAGPSKNIGVNRLTSEKPLWFTLADVLASKFLAGKTPMIDQAIAFEPGPAQSDLKPVDIAGRPEYRVDPGADFYRRVIELRQEVKARRDTATAVAKARLDSEQLALKILANATSYGIFIELIVEDLAATETLTCYCADGVGFPVKASAHETPGAYFHPLLGTLITGAARLMLALGERQVIDQGPDWIFCDTDSLAIAKADYMDGEEFLRRARAVSDWFAPLNPYAVKGPLLQVEDINFAEGHVDDWSAAPPLYGFAVSDKRYALFNLTEDGRPVIRKASAHGLGHLLPPYADSDPASRSARIAKIRVDLWQEDLWTRIINAVLGGATGALDLEADPRLSAPAAMRHGASTPELVGGFATYNAGRPYGEQVRPFNFLLLFQVLRLEQLAAIDSDALAWWTLHRRDPSPAAPFDKDPAKAARQAFDRSLRDTPIPIRWLQSYARTLSKYHLHPEAKFLGGDWTEAGALRRRHVLAIAFPAIGKEADHLEEELGRSEDDEAENEIGLSLVDRVRLVAVIMAAKKRFGVRALRRAAGVSDHTISKAISGFAIVPDRTLNAIAEGAAMLAAKVAGRERDSTRFL